MMLYKFLDNKWALDDIKRGRLKISRIDDLNDPYELNVIASENIEMINTMARVKADLHRMKGILCFSRDWKDPVIWSHYADGHKGVCLGFEYSEEEPLEVDYSPELLPLEWFIELINLEPCENKDKGVQRFLRTKYKVWEYEHESRIFTDLNSAEEDGNYYSYFVNDPIELREVILGVRCTTTVKEVEKLVEGYSSRVQVKRAALSPTRYEVIEAK